MTKLEQVVSLVGEQNHLQHTQMIKMLPILTPDELADAERTISFFTDCMGYEVADVADAYLWFVITFMENQIHFVRTGKYKHSTFAEIENYYEDTEIMRNYVVSLATTLYLLPQHIEVQRFYKHSLAKCEKHGRYLEIGTGHGHLFITAIENSNFSNYTGIDISETCVKLSAKYAEYCLSSRTNWQILKKNLFDFDNSDKFDAIVMGEVIEHVEKPEQFLCKIRDLAADDAFIYVTTAVNAPDLDHIYQFNTVEEVEEMFLSCGLSVKDRMYGIANGADFAKAVKKKYTIVPAYVLEKI